MKEKTEKYEKIYKLSFENEKILKDGKRCVCVYCFNRFDVSEIKDWIEDTNVLTAQCPHCQIDSVIPEVVDGEKITDEDLRKMKESWF